jgi:hypothetical protein
MALGGEQSLPIRQAMRCDHTWILPHGIEPEVRCQMTRAVHSAAARVPVGSRPHVTLAALSFGPSPTRRRMSSTVRLGLLLILTATVGCGAPAPSAAPTPRFEALARASLSTIDSTVVVDGLSAGVDVLGDRWGVPHIYAPNQVAVERTARLSGVARSDRDHALVKVCEVRDQAAGRRVLSARLTRDRRWSA